MACDVGIAGNTWGFDLDPSAVRLCRMILSIVEHCCAHMWVIQHIDQQFAFPEALLISSSARSLWQFVWVHKNTDARLPDTQNTSCRTQVCTVCSVPDSRKKSGQPAGLDRYCRYILTAAPHLDLFYAEEGSFLGLGFLSLDANSRELNSRCYDDWD